MTRFEIRSTHQPLKLMRLAHSRTRLPRRVSEPALFYQKFPRPRSQPLPARADQRDPAARAAELD